MQTIGQLIKQSGLSRSTLLYYDKVKLLSPSGRSAANYRLYTSEDTQRLSQILLYRQAGISLENIALLLDAQTSQLSAILEQRLEALNLEMSEIRHQQQLLLQLLGASSQLRSTKLMNKQQWIEILRASGMDEAAMRNWHIEFERKLPLVHSDFLQSLGIKSAEIATIKAYR
ncbi:MAG: MerR family transcriptional regulator [Pseudomonadales bacterium]|nr:MerR family transcriptional regulator [Pseudomonadales bacterium]NRA18480.1 MerR family transcriptional regulator [Oceanospirillaceae bacterium]